jgi:hypothetical protein
MSQTTTQESPAIDRLLSYINEYRKVMDWMSEKYPIVFEEWKKKNGEVEQ